MDVYVCVWKIQFNCILSSIQGISKGKHLMKNTGTSIVLISKSKKNKPNKQPVIYRKCP